MICLHLFTTKHKAASNEVCAQTAAADECLFKQRDLRWICASAAAEEAFPELWSSSQHRSLHRELFLSFVLPYSATHFYVCCRSLRAVAFSDRPSSGLQSLLYTLKIKGSVQGIRDASEEALFFRVYEAARGIG